MANKKLLLIIALWAISAMASGHTVLDCKDEVVDRYTVWYGEATCAFVDPQRGIYCEEHVATSSAWDAPYVYLSGQRLCSTPNGVEILSVGCHAYFPNSRIHEETKRVCHAVPHDHGYELVPGETYNHSGGEYSIAVSSTLWSSSGPITKRFGTLYKTMPNGTVRRTTISNMGGTKSFTYDDPAGTYQYHVETCHEYLNDPSYDQCNMTGRMTVIVTD